MKDFVKVNVYTRPLKDDRVHVFVCGYALHEAESTVTAAIKIAAQLGQDAIPCRTFGEGRPVDSIVWATTPPDPPADDLVRADNEHFGPEIRIVKEVAPYDGQFVDRFSHQITVGAHNSVIKAYFDGEQEHVVDAWATYLWDKTKKAWCLGAN